MRFSRHVSPSEVDYNKNRTRRERSIRPERQIFRVLDADERMSAEEHIHGIPGCF
jgi:hypothetical protein